MFLKTAAPQWTWMQTWVCLDEDMIKQRLFVFNLEPTAKAKWRLQITKSCKIRVIRHCSSHQHQCEDNIDVDIVIKETVFGPNGVGHKLIQMTSRISTTASLKLRWSTCVFLIACNRCKKCNSLFTIGINPHAMKWFIKFTVDINRNCIRNTRNSPLSDSKKRYGDQPKNHEAQLSFLFKRIIKKRIKRN